MDANTLANLLCRDIVHSVGQRDMRNFIVTRFRYPDGEYVLLYVVSDGDQVTVSDMGTTLFKCTVKRILPSEVRKEFIESVCRRYGIVFEKGELRKSVKLNTAGADCLSFCEGITRISGIQMDDDARHRSTLPEQIGKFLSRKIQPTRSMERRWSHPVLDRGGDYPVDFRITGEGEPRNIFYVGSPAKSTLVAAVSSFLKLHNAYSPTMTIVDLDVHLGRHYLGRLQRANDKIVFGLKGHEDAIVRFSSGIVAD